MARSNFSGNPDSTEANILPLPAVGPWRFTLPLFLKQLCPKHCQILHVATGFGGLHSAPCPCPPVPAQEAGTQRTAGLTIKD